MKRTSSPSACRSSSGAVVAEADDHRARVGPPQRLEQHLHALVLDQLAEVDDRRPVALEERREPRGIALVGQPLLGVPRIGRVEPSLREQAGERLGLRRRPPELDVDAGRDLVDAVHRPAHLAHDVADVPRADDRRRRSAQHLGTPRRELRVAAHRVFELGAVRLDDVAAAAGRAHRAAKEDVVDEDEIRRPVRAERGGVRLHPRVQLGARALLHPLDLVPLVAVDHEDRQQPADVRPHGLRAAEIEAIGMRLLGEHGDVVPLPAPLARQLARVDVRPRAPEQVAVPDEYPHQGYTNPVRSTISGMVTNSYPSSSFQRERMRSVASTEWLRS